MVNESIDLVCFDDRFVEGFAFYERKSEFSNYSMRSFIYQEGEDEAIYDDDPRYAAVVNRAALRKAEGKCGIEGSWKNFHVLLRDPKYRR